MHPLGEVTARWWPQPELEVPEEKPGSRARPCPCLLSCCPVPVSASCPCPQVEQSYLVLFCTHAAQLREHVQGLVLTVLVRGWLAGARSLRGLNQGSE